jgi:hypothetical protein
MKLYGFTEENKFKEYIPIDFQVKNREALLEEWLEKNPEDIIENGDLLIIGRQVSTNLGGFIDLLAIDRQGDTAVIEIKRNRTPRETLAQALEYVSFIEKLGYEQLEEILCKYIGEESLNLAQYHREFFQLGDDEASVFNNDQRIIIVGQTITPEIRQTSTFLGKKGIGVTCIEFNFFESIDGQHLLSTDIVIGKEADVIKRITTNTLPSITKDKFFETLNSFGKPIFEQMINFAQQSNYPIHWGTKGFSLNVDMRGTHVAICFGYPPDSVYKQSLYTAIMGRGGLSYKTNVPEELLIELRNGLLKNEIAQTAGNECKVLIDREFTSNEIDQIFEWINKAISLVRQYGLKDQDNEDTQ